jgi:hypothetical protein
MITAGKIGVLALFSFKTGLDFLFKNSSAFNAFI